MNENRNDEKLKEMKIEIYSLPGILLYIIRVALFRGTRSLYRRGLLNIENKRSNLLDLFTIAGAIALAMFAGVQALL